MRLFHVSMASTKDLYKGLTPLKRKWTEENGTYH